HKGMRHAPEVLTAASRFILPGSVVNDAIPYTHRMRRSALSIGVLPLFVLLVGGAAVLDAEEGMWTFDNFPIARANQVLGTRIDQAWLDRVRLSSVRFGGC